MVDIACINNSIEITDDLIDKIESLEEGLEKEVEHIEINIEKPLGDLTIDKENSSFVENLVELDKEIPPNINVTDKRKDVVSPLEKGNKRPKTIYND